MTEANKLPRVVYRLKNYGCGIEALLAVKETAKTLTIRESIGKEGWRLKTQRVQKGWIFEYAFDAMQELEKRAHANLWRKKHELAQACSKLERVRNLPLDDIHIPPIPEDVEG